MPTCSVTPGYHGDHIVYQIGGGRRGKLEARAGEANVALRDSLDRHRIQRFNLAAQVA